ncbi:hypothetical protein GH714_021156 [Hevea brasiliensis]|uniref:Uncharacterized protein n=1 Tax=Hevea brasiliensis TaxID=3981 RepID=A0A6A6M332_HEVBR|nr:hypothetical protein GH714_021156 [Hevea brasiliensis]
MVSELVDSLAMEEGIPEWERKLTIMMQELEQRQEVLRKEAEQRHQEALGEIKTLLNGLSLRNMEIASNVTQEEPTGAMEDPLEDIKNLKQESILQDYMDSFEQLYSKLGIQKGKGLSFFLSGLVDQLQISVRMFNPRTLAEAYSLARLQEITMAAIRNKAKPVTKPIIFVNTSFPLIPPNPQSNLPSLLLLRINLAYCCHPEIAINQSSFIHYNNGTFSVPKSVMVYQGGEYALVTRKFEISRKRRYKNCGDFELGDNDFGFLSHDHIILKEDEFEKWRRQGKRFDEVKIVPLLLKKMSMLWKRIVSCCFPMVKPTTVNKRHLKVGHDSNSRQ